MREGCKVSRHVIRLHAGVKYTYQCKVYMAAITCLHYRANCFTCLTPVKTHASLFTVNNKTVSDMELTDVDSFSPSRSSVLVNTLWYSSLSLSVGVSLVAMLSKSWCHSFISRRYGTKHKQANRRQQQWDSMNTWKMKDFMIYLPSLMHLSLRK